MIYDYLVVGAGFFGSVISERIANDMNCRVLLIDKRSHTGGNSHSSIDEDTGIEYHNYGTHIFHTDSREVWDYINRFTEFNGYHHQVLTKYRNKVYQMPINLETINSFFNVNLTPSEARIFMKEEIAREGITKPENLEEKAVSLIGRKLYEAFIKGYTMKQWDQDPRTLPAEIITRLPIRYNYCEDYFVNSRWQGIPVEGYSRVFDKILASPNIHVELNCDFFDIRDDIKVRKSVIYTGPIDRYFDYTYGKLDWRTIRFEKQVMEMEDFQGTSVMNYADAEVDFIRIHEPRHLHPERTYTPDRTVIFYDRSFNDPEEPYYPVNTKRNIDLFNRYDELARKEKGFIIKGRLGRYVYYDMDKTILSALKCYQEEILKNG